MDQMDLDSFTSLITPNRHGGTSIHHTPGHGDQLLPAGDLHHHDYPPLPYLPHNLDITPVSATPHSQDNLTPTVTDDYSFSFTKDLSSIPVPVTLDTTNMVTIKAVSSLHKSPAVKSPSQDSSVMVSGSPLRDSRDLTVSGSDGEGRANKRARKEPSRFRDFTSPTRR